MFTRPKFGNMLLNISIILLGLLLGANVYNSMVDVPNWGANIPVSLQHTRSYMEAANPGTFFRVFSPMNQIILVLALAVGWNKPRGRKLWIIFALVCSVGADIFTFAYFYPRNAILFSNALDPGAVEFLRAKLNEWATMNWVRSAVAAIGMMCTLRALHIPLDAEP